MRQLALALLFCGVAHAAPEARVALCIDGPDDSEDPGLSKKSAMLLEKSQRRDVHLVTVPKPPAKPSTVVTVRNLWTHESYPVLADRGIAPAEIDQLLRCHHTNQTTIMDARVIDIAVKAAMKFQAKVVDVVSAFRAPKYQLGLRKKGHEVARDSEHPKGNAIDFRLPDVPTKLLLRFVKSLRSGGVGFYPDSHFVHADTGRVRYWRGH